MQGSLPGIIDCSTALVCWVRSYRQCRRSLIVFSLRPHADVDINVALCDEGHTRRQVSTTASVAVLYGRAAISIGYIYLNEHVHHVQPIVVSGVMQGGPAALILTQHVYPPNESSRDLRVFGKRIIGAAHQATSAECEESIMASAPSSS